MPRALKGVNDIMHEDDPIKDLTTFHEAKLFLIDQGREDGIQSVGNHFGDNLVYHIIEGYGPEIVQTLGSHFLRDEG